MNGGVYERKEEPWRRYRSEEAAAGRGISKGKSTSQMRIANVDVANGQ